MKKPSLTLLLTAIGLWASIASSLAAPVFQSLPPAAVPANTNQALRRALQRVVDAGSNSPAPSITANSAASTNAPAALPATPSRLGSPPAANRAGASLPSGPTGTVTPAAGRAGAPSEKSVEAEAASAAATLAEGDLLPPGMIRLQGADLPQVLDVYSEWVNRTVLRPTTLPAPQIWLTTKTPLTRKEAVQALDAVLALNGIAMVNVGEKFVKAVSEATAITTGGAFDTNAASQLPDMGPYLTHVVQLKYAKPNELIPVLQPFSKIPNSILAVEGTQMLVLRDYAENVKRMLELVAKVDIAVPSEYVSEVIPIKYAKATDIAQALNTLSTGGGATSVGTGTTGARGSRGGAFARTGTTGSYPGQTTPGMMTPPGGAGMPTPAPAASSFSQRLQNIIQRASTPGGAGEIQVLGQTKMIADERTNSLLIYATKEDMKTIKEIVSKLDIVLAQVLIEAAIISVTLTDSRDLGVSYLEQTPHPANYFKGLGAINNNNALSGSPLVSAATNAASSLPSGFSYLASFGQDLDVTLTAAAANSRAKILQRPRIQTSHNEPASLFVGEQRPYPTSSYYGGGAYGGYSSINQLQIGVTIEVTPLINPDGLVVMDIHTKIDSFEGNVTIANVGDVPITSSKEAQAKISVRDHDTIILGGLIETDKNNNASGVPFLMDIPLLGNLFRSSHKDETRSELIVLIRPTVLPSPEIAALAAKAEKSRMPGVRGFEREIQDEDAQRLKQMDKGEKSGAFQPSGSP